MTSFDDTFDDNDFDSDMALALEQSMFSQPPPSTTYGQIPPLTRLPPPASQVPPLNTIRPPPQQIRPPPQQPQIRPPVVPPVSVQVRPPVIPPPVQIPPPVVQVPRSNTLRFPVEQVVPPFREMEGPVTLTQSPERDESSSGASIIPSFEPFPVIPVKGINSSTQTFEGPHKTIIRHGRIERVPLKQEVNPNRRTGIHTAKDF